MTDDYYPVTSNIWGLFWTHPTSLKLDVIYERSPSWLLQIYYRRYIPAATLSSVANTGCPNSNCETQLHLTSDFQLGRQVMLNLILLNRLYSISLGRHPIRVQTSRQVKNTLKASVVLCSLAQIVSGRKDFSYLRSENFDFISQFKFGQPVLRQYKHNWRGWSHVKPP